MIEFIIAALASYRLARMLSMEEGAFGMFANFRERFDSQQKTWVGRGLNCPLCVGFWTSLLFALLISSLTAQSIILNWFGLAGAMTILYLWIEKI